MGQAVVSVSLKMIEEWFLTLPRSFVDVLMCALCLKKINTFFMPSKFQAAENFLL